MIEKIKVEIKPVQTVVDEFNPLAGLENFGLHTIRLEGVCDHKFAEKLIKLLKVECKKEESGKITDLAAI